MKKIFLPLITTLASLSAFAADWGEARLAVSSYNSRNMTVVVDGYSRSSSNNGTAMIEDLRGGNHNIKVYEERRGGFFGKRYSKLVYESNLFLRANFITTLTIKDDNCVSVSEQPVYDRRDRGRHRGWDKDRDRDRDRRYDDNDRRYDGGYNYQMMDQRSYDGFKQNIRNASFDNNRLSVAQQGMNNYYFTAAQVKELVQLLSFDDSRLSLAKSAYGHCSDQQNYNCVGDALSFSNSRDELNRYIASSR